MLGGIEMMSNNMDVELRRMAAKFAARNPLLATLGNSDAHEVDVVGVCYTEFDAIIRSSSELVTAIRERRAQPRERLESSA